MREPQRLDETVAKATLAGSVGLTLVLWVIGVTFMGYFLGQIPFIHKNIDAVLILIVLVSLIPMGIEYLNHRREAKAAAAVSEVDPV